MKIFFTKEFLFGILIFLLLSLTPLLWFNGNQVIIGHDNVFPLQANEFFGDRLFAWSEHHGLGYDQSSGMGSIILHFIDVVPSFFGFSIQQTEKIVYCFWFFAMLFSAFIFCWKIEKWGYVSLPYFKYILPVLYTFNFYTLEAWWIGERTKFELMVAFPLFFVTLLSLLKSKGRIIRHAIFAGLLLTILNGGGWKGITLYGGLFITIFSFLLYIFFFHFENTKKGILRKYTLFFLSFSIFFLFLNAYSILPFLSHTLHQYNSEVAAIGGASNVKGWIDMISNDASFANLFRFQGIPEWYNGSHQYAQDYLHNPIFIAASYLFIILIFLSVLIKKNVIEKKFYFYFLALFLLSLFFTAGSHPPFGFLYLFFAEHIPGFAIFRSPLYKFGYAFWFAGAFLISYTLSYFVDIVTKRHDKKQRLQFVLGCTLSSFIIVLILLYYNPFLKGNLFIWSKNQLENRVEVPQYVFDTAAWIKEKNDGSRILLLPRANNNWRGDTYNWRFFSLYPLLADVSREPFLYNNDSLTGNEAELVNSLYNAILAGDNNAIYTISDMLRIKYLIVRKDFYSNLYWSKSESPDLYKKAIEKNSVFAYQKSFGKWDIYLLKRNSHVDHVYPYTSFSTYNGKGNFVPAFNLLSSYVGTSSAGKTVLVESSAVQSFPQSLYGLTKDNIFFYNCITCEVMSDVIDINFPVVRLLPTSPFYPLIESLRAMKEKEPPEGEQSGYHYLGEALRYTQELYLLQVNFYNKDKITREAAVKKTIEKLTFLYGKVDKWMNNYINTDEKKTKHYYTIAAYLDAQERKMQYFLEKDTKNLATGNPEYYFSLQKMLTIFNGLQKEVATYKNTIDYADEKLYFPQVASNNYKIYAQYIPDSASVYDKSFLKVNDATLQPVSNKASIVFYGTSTVDQNIPIILNLPQNNLAEKVISPSYKPLELQGSECLVVPVRNVKTTDNYRISLDYLNDFSDRLRFVIYTEQKYQKYLKKSLLLDADDLYKTDEQFSTKDFVFVPELNMDTVFIGVCANRLTKELFQEKIKIQIKNIYSPELILVTESNGNKQTADRVTYALKKIDQTKYKVDFKDVKNPFLLGFDEKYNSDWKAYLVHSSEKTFFTTWIKKPLSEDRHIMLNGFMNGWYIDDTGNYSIIIEYRPQKLFYQGLLVSGVTLLIGLLLLVKRRV